MAVPADREIGAERDLGGALRTAHRHLPFAPLRRRFLPFDQFLAKAEPFRWGAEIFSTGLWIALPLVAMLLFVNLVLGAISRVASQINIFAVGFPVTLGVGLIGILLTLPAMQGPFSMALERLLTHFQ